MAKGPMYVKDFDFSVQPCNYSYGGSAKAGQDVQMAKSKAVEKSMAGQKMTKMASGGYYAKGGMKEPESRMVKAPAISPKSPMRRAMPVAPAAPMIQPGAMKKGGAAKMRYAEGGKAVKVPLPVEDEAPYPAQWPMPSDEQINKENWNQRKAIRRAMGAKNTGKDTFSKGGFVPAGSGMVKTEGTLGIKGNKNPGEMNGKPTMATKTGNVPYEKGGNVKKYADGGPMMPAQGMPPQGRPAMPQGRPGQNMPPAMLQALKMAALKAQAMRGGQSGGMPGRRPMPGPMAAQMGGQAPQMDGQANMMKTGGKVAKVMGEFKSGDLHSGSKSGPAVKSRKQAMAIALSEARAGKKK